MLREKIIGIISQVRMKKDPAWREYKKRVLDKVPCVDYKKGCGYYLPETGLYFVNILEKHQRDEWKMASGKIGIWKLLDYSLYRDPDDMVEESLWQFLGYKGEKLIEEMSFEEFKEFASKHMKGAK